MNTSVEFFEWILQSQSDGNMGVLHLDEESPCRLEPPALVSFSDSELSSLDSDDAETVSMCSADCFSEKLSNHNPKTSLAQPPLRRRVSFQHVEVREYSITVGDHPFCYDGLPLTLDWEHADQVEIRDIDTSRERGGNYKAPRRLSFDERRDRLFNVTSSSDCDSSEGCEQQNDRSLELSLIIKMLHNSWSMNSILPPPQLYDIEEDEDEEDEEERRTERRRQKAQKKKQQQSEQVVEWKRVPFRRSNAFSE